MTRRSRILSRHWRVLVAVAGPVVALMTSPVSLGGQTAARRADPLIGKVKPEWIEASIRFLADDLLKGRETGQPGAELAAKYVAAQFEAAGLRPVAGFDDYLMPVPLRFSEVVAEGTRASARTASGEVGLEYGVDFLVHPDKNRDRDSFSGEVVFVGWGVTVPGRYDDYAGVDVRGKVVATVFGGPPSVPSDERGHFATLAMKDRNAREHGAVGTITLLPAPAPVVARALGQLDGFGWVDRNGAAHSPFFEIGSTIRLTAPGIQKVFGPKTLDSLIARLAAGPVTHPTGVTIAFEGRYRHRSVIAHNAIGMVEGSDPVLKNEYVVYSAHLDHVGVTEPVAGDSVNHGAIDNAGGTAVVAALARAYGTLPRPKRSAIFLAVTAEEKGILGSDYFIRNPPVPAGSIVANVNLDNAVLTRPIKDLVAYGAEYSTLGELVKSAIGRLGLRSSADPLPGMTIFTRSDHYTFMMAGVPGVMLFPGKASDLENQRKWFSSVHHTPRDRFDQGIDWNAAVTYATANLMIGYQAGNGPRPKWKGKYFFHRDAPGGTIP